VFIFDTDSISQIIRKQPSLSFIRRLSGISPEHQFTTTITVGELIYGAYKSNRPEYFIEKLDSIVWPNISILPFDEDAARIYGKLRADLERKGMVVSEPDMRIASIALYHNFTVITGNTRHFSKIPGLKIGNWIEERP